MRSRKRLLLLLGALSMAFLLGACADRTPSAPAGGATPIFSSGSSESTSPDPSELAAISAIDQLAAASGGSPTSIEYVEASRSASLAAFFPHETGSDANDPSMTEVALIAHGTFNINAMKHPPVPAGVTPPTYTMIFALYSPTISRITDWGLTTTEPNIGSLGVVQTTTGN